MSDPQADRSLLVGILALQMNFIDRDQFMKAISIWSAAKTRRVEEILLEIGALREDTLAFVIAMAKKHLELHDDDAAKSLAALSSIASIRHDLAALADPAIDATLHLVRASSVPRPDADATLPFRSSLPSSSRFRILRPHAKGGLGEVSVARDDELNREVALKEIQNRYVRDPASRNRFLLEAEITGGLEHPGIVPVYSLGQSSDGRPFYAMRFIRGDSLNEAIADFHRQGGAGAPSGERMLQLRKLLGRLVDVCDAVTYAHARGILHRDLKPGNVMLGKYGETMVVDWGLAKPLGHTGREADADEATLVPRSGDSSASTEVGTSVGTPGYMSPEQAEGQLDRLGPATDVYSLGATMYCLLAGRPPIRGEVPAEFLRKVRCGEFPRPTEIQRDVPRPLEAVCLKALATRPQDRYPSPRDLADDIERWLADEPVTVYREPLVDRLARTVRRHRSAFAAAAALVVAGLLALTVISGLMRRQNRNLQIARKVAETNEQLAVVERNRAEANLAVSREWALKLLGLAEGLARTPGQGPLRRKMTDDSLKVFQQLYGNQPNDPLLRRELAQVLRVWANVMLADDLTAALQANQEAVALLNPRASDPPPDTRYRDQLAETLRDQANLLKRMGRFSDAANAFERALNVVHTLRQELPEDPRFVRTEATVKSDFASLQIHLDQLEPALVNSTSAVSAFRQLADGPRLHPLDPLLLLLAIQTNAELFRRTDRLQDAEELLAEGLRRARSQADPDANVQFATGRLLFERSQVLARSDSRIADAKLAADESIAIWERLVGERADSNRFDTYRLNLARALTGRADLHGKAQQLDDSQTDLAKAIEICNALLAKASENQSHREAMVETLYQQSRLASRRSDRVAAVERIRQSLDMQEQIVKQSPESQAARQQLARLKSELQWLTDADEK